MADLCCCKVEASLLAPLLPGKFGIFIFVIVFLMFLNPRNESDSKRLEKRSGPGPL